MGGLSFSILGPLEVTDGDGPITPAGHTPRLLLAALLLNANHVLSADQLVELLWKDPPPSARNALQVHVSRLRKQLATPNHDDEVLLTRRPGYMIRIEPGALDSERFQTLADEGAAAMAEGAPAIAAPKLDEALALWRGRLLDDLVYEPYVEGESARWEDARLAVLEHRIDADLQLGKHAELVGELRTLCAEHLFRERFHSQLVLALYRSGRQADALQSYQVVRNLMVNELGVEPSTELKSLHDMVLRQDAALDLTGARSTGPLVIDPTTGSLPMLGRETEIAALDDALRLATQGRRVVVALEGPAGHGKTRLLEEWLGGLDLTGLDLRRASAFRARGSSPGDLAGRLSLGTNPPSESDGVAVVVVDDLQWADTASQGVLGVAISSGPREASVLMVLAHRPVAGLQRATIDRVIAGAGPDGEQLTMRLRPLRPHDLAPLIAGDEPMSVAESLIKASRGIPFELQRAVGHIVDAGIATFVNGQVHISGVIPEHLATNATRSLTEITHEERRLVEVVCLARAPVEIELASKAAGIDPDVATRIMSGDGVRSLVTLTPEGLMPVHDLAADEVIAQVDKTFAAAALRAFAERAAEAGTAGMALAGAYLIDAGFDEEAIPLLAEAGIALIDTGSQSDALPVLDAALGAISRAGPKPELEARLLRKRAMAFDYMSLFDSALEDLKSAEGVDHRVTVESLTTAAYVAGDNGRLHLAEVTAALAVGEAIRGGDPALIALSMGQQAFYLSGMGFVDEPRALISKAAAFEKHLAPHQLFQHQWWIATVPAWEYDVRASEAAWRVAVETGRSMGDSALTDTIPWLARDLFFMGRVDEGLALCEEAARLAHRIGSGILFTSMSNTAWGLETCGLYADALAWADDELELTLSMAPRYEYDPRLHRSIALLGLGRITEARDEYENAVTLALATTDDWHFLVRCRMQDLAVIASEGGKWPLAQAEALTEELRSTRRLIPLAEALSLRATKEAKPELAIEAAQVALDIGAPMVGARAALAGDLWDTPIGMAVAHRVREMAQHIPAQMYPDWIAQAAVSRSFEDLGWTSARA